MKNNYIVGKSQTEWVHNLHFFEWSTERPKEAGLYWAYGKPKNRIVKDEPELVDFDPRFDTVDVMGIDVSVPVSFYTHWIGPLPMPDKPQE